MKLRKIADEAEARRALATASRSGRALGLWARERGIDGRSLQAWKLAFERRERPVAPKLIELVPATPVTSSRAPRYVIRFGEVSFEFGDDAQTETLQRVLRVLRSC
jgi:hypothetical protein